MRLTTLMLASLVAAGCGEESLPVVIIGYDLVGTGTGDLSMSPPADLAVAPPEDLSQSSSEDLVVEPDDIKRAPFDLIGEVINGCNGLFKCVQGCKGANLCEQMCAAASTKMAKKLLAQLDACVIIECPMRASDAGVPPCAKPNSPACMMCRMAAVAGPCAPQYQACVADIP